MELEAVVLEVAVLLVDVPGVPVVCLDSALGVALVTSVLLIILVVELEAAVLEVAVLVVTVLVVRVDSALGVAAVACAVFGVSGKVACHPVSCAIVAELAVELAVPGIVILLLARVVDVVL